LLLSGPPRRQRLPFDARIFASADVYDALRSHRIYKPALSHASALHLILEGSTGQFEHALLKVFQRCATQFDRIFEGLSECRKIG
jgi:putative two-component system response regulator